MDRETKELLIVLGIGLAIIFIARPKKSSSAAALDFSEDKYKAPKSVDASDKKNKDSAVTGLQAMRAAINDGKPAKDLEELKKIIHEEDGIKILINKNNGLLRATTTDGKVIAEEE